MSSNTRLILICALTAGTILASGGCTSEEIYYSTQHWQRQECRKLRGENDRARCETRPTMSYEEYLLHREKQAANN